MFGVCTGRVALGPRTRDVSWKMMKEAGRCSTTILEDHQIEAGVGERKPIQ